jgi:hypothetical protein
VFRRAAVLVEAAMHATNLRGSGYWGARLQSIDRRILLRMAETPAPVTRTKSEKKMKWDEKNLRENEAIQVSMEQTLALIALILCKLIW